MGDGGVSISSSTNIRIPRIDHPPRAVERQPAFLLGMKRCPGAVVDTSREKNVALWLRFRPREELAMDGSLQFRCGTHSKELRCARDIGGGGCHEGVPLGPGVPLACDRIMRRQSRLSQKEGGGLPFLTAIPSAQIDGYTD